MYKLELELSYGCFSSEPMKRWLKEMRGDVLGGKEERGDGNKTQKDVF